MIGVVLLWSVVVPAVDESIDRDEIPAGTTARLLYGVTFAPAAGWVYGGAPSPGAPSLTIYEEGVEFAILVGRYEGTSRELLEQVTTLHDDWKLNGDVRAVPLPAGVVGAARELQGSESLGAVFAFAQVGIGVEVYVQGPPTLVRAQTEAIGRMVASTRFPPGAGE